MRNNQFKILAIFLVSFIFLINPLSTFAAVTCPGTPCPSGKICISNPLCADTFEKLILAIVDIIFTLALAIAPLMIIIAGFYFLTAAGEPAKINTAKTIILWTAVGLLVIICAKGIIALFQRVFMP